MEPLSGFVTVPRLAGYSRPTGAFYSVTVNSAAGPGRWSVTIDGKATLIASEVELVVGQTLRMKLVSQTDKRLVLQVLPQIIGSRNPVATEPSSLMAAFISRGLPLASERLQAWSRWMTRVDGPSDKEAWAASAAARNEGPLDPLTVGLQPWLAWLADLEAGRPHSMPRDGEFWDEWNRRNVNAGDPWLVVPVHWEHEGQLDCGLLQAHWNPPSQRIDCWNFTASPASVPFRLEAQCSEAKLDLTWRFFIASHRDSMERAARAWQESLSTPGFKVRLNIAGAPVTDRLELQDGIDVQA